MCDVIGEMGLKVRFQDPLYYSYIREYSELKTKNIHFDMLRISLIKMNSSFKLYFSSTEVC